MGWATVIGAIFQIVLLLVQTHATNDADVKALKAAQVKDISDAISSGDVSRINAAVGKLRK